MMPILLACCLATPLEVVAGSASDPEHVDRLVRRLDHAERAEREAAEKALLELGTDVLPLLPSPALSMPPDMQERLKRVRQELERANVRQTTNATRLTIQGRRTLDELLQEIKQQTGNRIVDYRDRFGQSADPLRIQVDVDQALFWTAIDRILDQENLSVYNYVGEPRTMGIVQRAPGEQSRVGAACIQGPFRIEPLELTAVRSLRNAINCGLRLRLEVLWEPRLAPLLLRQNLEDVRVVGDDGSPIEIVAGQTSIEIPVQSTVAGVEMVLPMELPKRSVARIRRIEGRFTAVVPGREETFEFQDLAEARNRVQQRGGLTVTLERARKNGSLHEFRIRLQMADAQEAFQSHLDWSVNNEIYLLAADGTRVENPNFERYLERSDEVGFAYLFPVPGEITGYRLIYRSPAAMIDLPVDYVLEEIKLP